MKKLLFMLVCTVLTVSALSAGGASDTSSGKKQVLKVAGFKGGYGSAYWDELKKGFEAAYPNVEVQLIVESQLADAIRPQIMAGAGPDVIYLATNQEGNLTEMMIDSKMVRDLSGCLNKSVYGEKTLLKDRLLSSIMGNGITDPYAGDAKHYLLPLFFASNGLFFNADLFYDNDGNGKEDAKKDGKYEMPATWDEFFALGEMLNAERASNPKAPYLFTYPTAGYLDTLVPASIAASAGEAVVKQAFQYEPIWGRADVKVVFETFAKIRDYILPTTVGNANAAGFKQNQQAVIDGKALFMVNGDWVVGEMKDTTPKGFNWGSAPFLAFKNGGERYGTVHAEQIFISTNTKVPELAEQFLLYLYSKKGLAIIAKHATHAFVPAKGYDAIALEQGMNAGAVAGYKGYYSGAAKVLAGSFASAKAEGINWKATYCETMDSVMNGTKTAAQWIEQLKKDSAVLKTKLGK